MRPDIGRYLEGRLLKTVNLIKTLYDTGLGAGPDSVVWIEGKELVFGKGEQRSGPGFMRLLPTETWLLVYFPRGSELPDPLGRLSGVRGSRFKTYVRDSDEIDPYLRRLIDAAYSVES